MSCITSPRVSNLNLIVRGRFFSNNNENTFHIYFLIGLTILDGGTFWRLIRGSRHHREENGRMTCSQEEKRGKRVGSDPRVPRSKKADHPRRSHLRLQPSSRSHASTLHFCPLVLTFFSLSKLPPFFSNLHHSSISFYHWFLFHVFLLISVSFGFCWLGMGILGSLQFDSVQQQPKLSRLRFWASFIIQSVIHVN